MKAVALAAALVLLVAGHDLEAQEAVRRIGILSGGSPSFAEIEGLRRGFREHGYVEGRNTHVEWRFAEGRTDRLPGLAAELVRLKVERKTAEILRMKIPPSLPLRADQVVE